MKIDLPVAQFHEGNTSEYVQRALIALKHQATIIPGQEFIPRFLSQSADLYFCIDSGLPLNFLDPRLKGKELSRVAIWFIDYRHNKDRTERRPTDRQIAQHVSSHGGWIFQAQYEDFLDCLQSGIQRCSWLPLGADPEIWSDQPVLTREFDLGFIGNVWDTARQEILEKVLGSGFSCGFSGGGSLLKHSAAEYLRRSRVAFNVNSFFGSEHAYDVNMRLFESLSCGLPLFTNFVPSLERLGIAHAPFIRTFRTQEDLIPKLELALRDEGFCSSGERARRWILERATYLHRMQEALETLKRFDAIEEVDPLPLLSFRARRSKIETPTRNIQMKLSTLSQFFEQCGWHYGLYEYSLDFPGSCRVYGAHSRSSVEPLLYQVNDALLLGEYGLLVSPHGFLFKESVNGHSPSFSITSNDSLNIAESEKKIGEFIALIGPAVDEISVWVEEYLPRVVLGERSGFQGSYIVSPRAHPFVGQSLELLGIPRDRIVWHDEVVWWVESLIVPQVLRRTHELRAFPELMRELGNRLISGLGDNPERKTVQKVFLVSEDEIAAGQIRNFESLAQLLSERGFEQVLTSPSRFRDVVDRIHGAELIVTTAIAIDPFGTVVKERARIIEIFGHTHVNSGCEISRVIRGVEYQAVIEELEETQSIARSVRGEAPAFDVDLTVLTKLLSAE